MEIPMNRSETPLNALNQFKTSGRNGATPAPQKLTRSAELEEIFADEQWVQEQFNEGVLDEYEGKFVVVYNKQIIASDPKYRQAKKNAAKKMGDIPVTRFAIMYVPTPE